MRAFSCPNSIIKLKILCYTYMNMKMPPKKVFFASIIAILFISFSLVTVFKGSTKAKPVVTGELSANIEPLVENLEAEKGPLPSDNKTDVLSRQVFSNFMVLKTSGSLNNQNVDYLANDLSSQILDSVSGARVYSSADLKIVENASLEDLKIYGNSFFLIRDKYQNLYISKSIAHDSPFIDSSETGIVNSFSLISEIYSKILPDLIKLPVPSQLTSVHLKLINLYSSSAYSLKKYINIDNDPVSAIAGLSQYGKNATQEESTVEQIANYFRQSGIIFTIDDPGYGWNNI